MTEITQLIKGIFSSWVPESVTKVQASLFFQSPSSARRRGDSRQRAGRTLFGTEGDVAEQKRAFIRLSHWSHYFSPLDLWPLCQFLKERNYVDSYHEMAEFKSVSFKMYYIPRGNSVITQGRVFSLVTWISSESRICPAEMGLIFAAGTPWTTYSLSLPPWEHVSLTFSLSCFCWHFFFLGIFFSRRAFPQQVENPGRI